MHFPELKILGVMSGSSLDGLDLGICKICHSPDSGFSWKIEKATTCPFDRSVFNGLTAAYTSNSSFIHATDQVFTEFCAATIIEFIQEDFSTIDCIGFHGHTIFHEPRLGYTVQLGNAQWLAQNIGIDVIADFRSKDIALGGEGAPLAPIVEKYFFPKIRLFLNLGGIVNISAHKSNGDVSAFDITACNQALNHLALKLGQDYDHEGMFASKGQCNQSLLAKLDSLPFLSKKPPKSLSNTWVRNQFIQLLDSTIELSVEDKLATVVQHIASQIGKAVKQLKQDDKIMVSGGGVHNKYMMTRINEILKKQNIELIIGSSQIAEYKESLLMALMAFLRLNEIPNCLSSVTGAHRDSCGGIIYNWRL